MIIKSSKQAGFTLIEMIVSLALFSVVVTVAIGALLMLVGTNEELQGEQSVMTNLSFALDSMTREIRTGTRYNCVSSATLSSTFNNGDWEQAIGDNARDCQDGREGSRFHGVSFLESGDSITESAAERILYYYDEDTGRLLRRIGDADAQSVLAENVEVTDANIYVTGSASVDDSPGDTVQPTVTIILEARERDSGDLNPKSFLVQTTITQRTLDI